MLDKSYELTNLTGMALKKWLIKSGSGDSIRKVTYFVNHKV